MTMYGEKEFSKDVICKFGDFFPELAEEPDMLHTQMGYLADAIRQKLACSNDILSYVEALLKREDAVSEIENAVAISFIELDEVYSLKLEASIPPSVHRVLRQQQERWSGVKNT